MSSTFTSLFCKTAACPTSQALLAYRGSHLSAKEQAFIKSHMGSCDFCSAELQLLARYRREADDYSFAEMPIRLRRLAEALLHRSTAPITGFAELVEHGQLSH